MAKFLLWLILFVLCWPLAVFALVAFPFVWLILLPFKVRRDRRRRRLRVPQGAPLPARRASSAAGRSERSGPREQLLDAPERHDREVRERRRLARVAGRDERGRQAERDGLLQAQGRVGHGPHLAEEADLAERERPRRERAAAEAARDGRADGEVGRRLDALGAARDVQEDVVRRERQPAVALEDREEEREARRRRSRSRCAAACRTSPRPSAPAPRGGAAASPRRRRGRPSRAASPRPLPR